MSSHDDVTNARSRDLPPHVFESRPESQWLLAQGHDIIPIPGSTRAERVEENANAVAVERTPEDIAQLDAIAPDVAGERYPEGGMRTLNR